MACQGFGIPVQIPLCEICPWWSFGGAFCSCWQGQSSILVYNAYGYSGARWNAALKKLTHNLIEAALTDGASRGLPAIFGGDLNLQIEAPMVLQRMSQHDWCHIPRICGMPDEPTCFKVPGSAIDHVFFNAWDLSAFQYFNFGNQISDHLS